MTIGVLTACGPAQPLEGRPNVAWLHGEPSGPLEDDPWVQAVRASELEIQIAAATLDFAEPALYETTIPDWAARAQGVVEDRARAEEWAYPPGPSPMIPVHVEEAPDGNSATVTACHTAWTEWLISPQNPEPPEPRGYLSSYRVTLKDGKRLVDSGGAIASPESARDIAGDAVEPLLVGEGGLCKLDDAAIGLFDPQPDVNAKYAEEDIAMPSQSVVTP